MHLKAIAMEGFKCHKERVTPDQFAPSHNVVGARAPPSMPPHTPRFRTPMLNPSTVGANGSGKSNFFAAIQFVLGDVTGGQLRQEERKQLLHEGAGTHVMSAYVEIYFDNRDRRFPIEDDQVVLKRAIGLKKDEYAGLHQTCRPTGKRIPAAGTSSIASM